MAIPTYTGGTGIKAPRIDKGLAGNKAGAWLALAGGALRAASGFDFVFKARADEKRASSTAAKNRLLLAHNAQMRDLARDAIDDPDLFGKKSDGLVRSHLAEWDRARDADEISAADHAVGTQALLTGQASYRKSIDDRFLRQADQRKVKEAELAGAEQVANPMAIGAGLASADGQANGIAANQMAQAEAAYMDPQGPWASLGPAAQALALNDHKREVSKAAISSRVMTVYGEGGDVGPMIQELRTRSGIQQGVWGFQMPNGLRVGGLLDGDTLDRMADNLEADVARLEREKVQQGNGAADKDGLDSALRIMQAVDAYKEGAIDAPTLASMGPALGLTTEQTMKYLGQAREASTRQLAEESALRPAFDEWLAQTDSKVRVSRNPALYEARMLQIGRMEEAGLVSENWATARRKTLQSRIDQIAGEERGTLSLEPTAEGVMDRIRATVGARTSTAPGARETYLDQSEQFGHPDAAWRVHTIGNEEHYRGTFYTDVVRGDMIAGAAQQALGDGVPAPVVEFNSALSIASGGNGEWVEFANKHGRGDGGVQGAQDLWQTSPKIALRSFPNVERHQDLLAYDAGGAIAPKATVTGIFKRAIARAEEASKTLVFGRWRSVPVSEQDIEEALLPEELFMVDFITSLEQFLAFTPPVPDKVQEARFDRMVRERKAERDLAEMEATP